MAKKSVAAQLAELEKEKTAALAELEAKRVALIEAGKAEAAEVVTKLVAELEEIAKDYGDLVASAVIHFIKAKSGKAKATGGGRMTKAQISGAVEAVEKFLKGKGFTSKGDIAKGTDLLPEHVNSALAKMKRDGLAASNGQRGAGGAWKLSK